MGRPLPSRFFGNRNTGSASTTADDGIGGEGVASINWSNYGSWLSNAGGALAPLAGLALPAPSLPGGVQATWTNYFGASAVQTGAGKAGLVTGNTYEYADIPGLVITVGSTAGANALFTVTAPGSTAALLTDLTGVTITKLTGGGAGTFLVDISLKIVDTVIGEKGSGYNGTETFTVTLANSASGTVPVGTLTLTTPDGIVTDDSGYNFATIKVTAKTTSGGSALVGDIVAQKGSRRYRVATADGTAVCNLVAGSPAVNEMSLIATDYSANTYYVTKLTRHRVLLTQLTGSSHEFATGSSAAWTLDTLVAGDTGVTVQLANN